MKKKIIALIMAMVLILLVSCSSDEPSSKSNSGNEKDKKYKIALLVGYLGDMSFNDSANVGIEKAKKDFPNADFTIIRYGTSTDKLEPTVVDTSEEGYDMIIGDAKFKDYYEKYAPDYPDTTYVLFDGTIDWEKNDYKNVYTIQYKANEASYLGGYVAAKLSKTGTIGFLGGMDLPVINDFLVGYIEGAKKANPQIKVAISYVGNFTDSSKGKELSFAMMNQGSDFTFNVAGGAGVGLIEAAVEKQNYVLGVDSDQAMLYHNNSNEAFASVIPTSVLKNIGDSLYRTVDLYLKGELKVGKPEILGIKDNGVGLAENEYSKKMIDAAITDEVKKINDSIINGEIDIPSAYGMTTDEISKIREDIKP